MLACAAGIGFNLWMAFANRNMWNHDFIQFYSAGRLLGTGRLYDPGSLFGLERKLGTGEVPFHRIPAYAAGFKLLSLLPYPTARLLWLAVSASALALSIAICPFGHRSLAGIVICWSQPAALCLAVGQDPPILLLFATATVLLLRARKPAIAGLVVSLWSGKPHFGIGFPLLLGVQRRWRAFFAAAAAVLTIAGTSFLMEGADWPVRLLSMLKMPVSDRAPERMPNLRGLASWLPSGSFLLEAILALAAILLAWRIFVLYDDPEIGVAVTVALGLLLGHHAYLQDALVLAPLLVLVLDREIPDWLRVWAVILVSPLPYFLLTTTRPYAGQLLIAGFVFAVVAWLAIRTRPEFQTPEPAQLL